MEREGLMGILLFLGFLLLLILAAAITAALVAIGHM